MLGEFRRPPETRTRESGRRFFGAGIRCTVTDNLEQAHWEKLVWNIPFNGLGVASAAGFDAYQRLDSPPPGRPRLSSLAWRLSVHA